MPVNRPQTTWQCRACLAWNRSVFVKCERCGAARKAAAWS